MKISLIRTAAVAVSAALVPAFSGCDSQIATAELEAAASGAAAWQESGEGKTRPRAAIVEPEYDFGTMDVGQQATHSFHIRNEGDGILELKAGRSTCQCTKFEIDRAAIPPGESARVDLHWETTEAGKPFHHGAVVRTNDPDHREIMLRIKGKVKSFMASSPGGVVFSAVRSGDQPHQRILIYSQEWERFEIAKVESAFKNVSWEVTAATPEELQQLDAVAGYGLELKLDSNLPYGEFQGKVLVHPRVLKSDGSQTDLPPLKVHVLGHRIGNATLVGPVVDSDGFLDVGLVRQDKGVSHIVHLFLRGGDDIGIDRIESEPAFLQVKAERAASPSPNQTRYRLDIKVPRGAPVANYMTEMAEIHLHTNSDADSEVRIKVKMAVVAAN